MNTKPALQTIQATSPARIIHARLYLAAMLLLGAAGYTSTAHPETSDIATGPLTNAASSSVRPNLMFILDDSGSMASDSLTGFESSLVAGTAVKVNGSGNTIPGFFSSIGRASNNASSGNGAYYNPAVTYLPPVNADGTLRANSTPTAAPRDGYGILTGSTTNLGTKCFSTATVPLQPTYSIDTGAFVSTSTTECKTSSGSGFTEPRARFSFYYQYNNTLFVNAGPASGRFECRPPPPAGSAPAGSVYPRVTEGRCYTRVDIIDTITSYPVRNPDGTLLSPAVTRTYAQEIQNFANWFSYSRTRINIMKTGAGRAFSDLGDNFRVGFITINPVASGSSVSSSRYLPLAKFDAAQKLAWYTKFYAQGTPGGTPLPQALSRVGRHYAGMTDGINSGMNEDPVEFSCQQNFALLTTDGFWTTSGAEDIAGASVGNQDNVVDTAAPLYVTRASGTFDGNVSGASNTLADVAMYYYKTDLRTPTQKPNNTGGIAVNDNNVPTTGIDFANHQHMTTFTLGLGVTGNMTYRADYQNEVNPSPPAPPVPPGHFKRITLGDTSCPWVGGTCNWPLPVAGALSAVDDLWHAAANGRGVYFNAQDPTALTDGLKNALLSIGVTTGAAAASATSTNNITPADNNIYSATYQTGKWDGELTAQKIDTADGQVIAAATWKAQSLLDAKVATTTDTRTIYTFDGSATTKLKSFLFANLTAAEQAFFTNKCVATFQLSHCGTLTGAALTASNSGTALVNYLRGQTGNEGSAFRDRDHVLGDIVHAQPKFLKAPIEEFIEEDYAAFKLKHTTTTPRQGVVYMGANDGMLHAFNNDTGQELWAYVPKMLLPDMYKLADENYPDNHRFYVDSTPEYMDICVPPNPVGAATCTWKTILVSGLGAGGRGFYALDITDPLNPKAMWEICSDSARCAISDADIGLSYARPVVTKRAFDNKWVVLITSGLNNVSPGDGKGYLYVLDAVTGAVLKKVTTGVGDTATCTAPTLCGPSGFAHISVHADAVRSNNLGLWVYGGDLWGNVWRFDLSQATPTVLKLAELKDAGGKPQSVTTYPEITNVKGNIGPRIVYFGTGRYLGTRDLPDPATLTPALPYAYQQSQYAIKDTDTTTVGYGNFRALGGPEPAVQQVLTTDPSGTFRTVSNNPIDFASSRGWYLDFPPDGERMVLDLQLVEGTLLVDTIVPFSNACTTGGNSWNYELFYRSGSYISTAPLKTGTKFLSLTVGSVVIKLPDGRLKRISTSSTGEKTTTGINVVPKEKVIRRMSWREILKQ